MITLLSIRSIKKVEFGISKYRELIDSDFEL